MNFLTDKKLSEMMFVERHDFKYLYDEILVDSLRIKQGPGLYILHLQGQHYAYENRYPGTFKRYKASDYDKTKWSESQREIIAHYDNATLYNDYVINELIKKCQDENVCLIYFSDHGEEIYEVRNYMGHGDANGSKEALRRQVEIPFMIWVSDSFRRNNDTLVHKIGRSVDMPVSTKDLAHIMLGIGEIRYEGYDPKRDFLKEDYERPKSRMVLNSINYDAFVQKLD